MKTRRLWNQHSFLVFWVPRFFRRRDVGLLGSGFRRVSGLGCFAHVLLQNIVGWCSLILPGVDIGLRSIVKGLGLRLYCREAGCGVPTLFFFQGVKCVQFLLGSIVLWRRVLESQATASRIKSFCEIFGV